MSDSGPVFIDDDELRLPPGTVVAGATVVGEMARGGMSVVYRARREDGTLAVLKVGTMEASARPGTEERFRNEERMGARLRHPNLVRPLAVGCLDKPKGFEGRMFLLTEYVDAPSLSYVLLHHGGGVPTRELWPIALQLAAAMVAMHEVGIVHRDIKPDNILVGDDGRVHVIDFGLAFSLGDVAGEHRSEELTEMGDAPGTPLYMSPQQAMHNAVSRSFDIYAFGVLLYEMCCGRAPHGHLPLREIAAARSNAKSKPLSLRIMAPSVPDALVQMVERCMAYEPELRPTALELLSFFEKGAPREGAAEERTTAPELRVVLPSVEPDEPSEATMVQRRPLVVAAGARPAGDETMVKLVRDAVDLPSVRRVHDELAKVDERIIVSKPMALAVMALEEGGCERETDVRASDAARPSEEVPSKEPVPEPDGRRREIRAAVVVVVVVLVLLVGMGAVVFGSGRTSQGGALKTTAPASVVGLEDADTKKEAGPEPSRGVQEAGEPPREQQPAKSKVEAVVQPAEKPKRPVVRRKKKPAQQRVPKAPKAPEAPPSTPSKPPKGPSSNRPEVSTDELRAEAKSLLRAGRYDDCIALAKGARDAEVARITSMCKRRKERGGSPL